MLAALATAYRSSARPGPVMDELAFSPAPAAGKGLWTIGELPALVSALGSAFGGTGQPGTSLPLIVDNVQFASAIPPGELSLYSSATLATTGLDEPSQGAAYAAALTAVACVPTVEALLIGRLVDGPDPGEQSGLFYADGTPKTSLSAVAAAAATAQTPTRGCTTSPPSTVTPAPAPSPGSCPSHVPTAGDRTGSASATHPDRPSGERGQLEGRRHGRGRGRARLSRAGHHLLPALHPPRLHERLPLPRRDAARLRRASGSRHPRFLQPLRDTNRHPPVGANRGGKVSLHGLDGRRVKPGPGHDRAKRRRHREPLRAPGRTATRAARRPARDRLERVGQAVR